MPELGLGEGFEPDPIPVAPHAAASIATAAKNTKFFIRITETRLAAFG
jgi:hypothetical protein